MDAYSLGQRAALLKFGDYADTIAKEWSSINPVRSRVAEGLGGLAGAGLGGMAGGLTSGVMQLKPHDVEAYVNFAKGHGVPLHTRLKDMGMAGLRANPAETILGGIGGAATGGHLGMDVSRSAVRAIGTNRRAAAIRKYVPRVGGGLGATALAAGLASHLLSRGDDY